MEKLVKVNKGDQFIYNGKIYSVIEIIQFNENIGDREDIDRFLMQSYDTYFWCNFNFIYNNMQKPIQHQLNMFEIGLLEV